MLRFFFRNFWRERFLEVCQSGRSVGRPIDLCQSFSLWFDHREAIRSPRKALPSSLRQGRLQIVGLGVIFILLTFGSPSWAQRYQSKDVPHSQAYKPRPERGPHIDIKVTPPGRRGADGRVLVEIYNRGTTHLALVQADVTLSNRGGYQVSAEVKGEDLRPNMSGAQWIKIPKIKDAFPEIDSALVSNVRVITSDAREVKMKLFVDLIKK